MKKAFLFLIFILVVYSVYYDIKVGTLPAVAIDKVEMKEKGYYNVKVEPGDTVLSLIEEKENGLPVPIEQIIEDFRFLNNGLNPENIKIGETYKFKQY